VVEGADRPACIRLRKLVCCPPLTRDDIARMSDDEIEKPLERLTRETANLDDSRES
jgi:hypothetical protein